MAPTDRGRTRVWRFRLNEGTTLEVLAPAGATEKQVRRRGRISLVLGTLVAAVMLAGVALAADTNTDASLSGNVALPTTVSIGSNSFTINVWATGNLPGDKTGAAVVANKYVMANDGTITPSTNVVDRTTLNFTVDQNYNQNPPCGATQGASIQGCPNNPFVVNAALEVAVGTPNSTTGALTVSMTGSNGLTADGSPDTGYVIVSTPVVNSAPVVDADTTNAGYSGAEGSAIALDRASATDPDGPGPLNYLWTIEGASVDGGSCSLNNATSLTAATITCDDDGTATVRLTATEAGADGKSGSDTASVVITNENPAITSASFGAGSPPHVACGTNNAPLTVSFADAGSNDTHEADVDWDGASPPVYDENVDPFTSGGSIAHTYGAAGAHTAKVKITDDDGGESNVASASVVVDYNTSGILQPVNDTRNGQPVSVFKYKSTIPVKIRVTDCDGSVASSLAPTVSFQKLSGDPPAAGADEAASTVPPTEGITMRWDAVAQQYIYNLATKQLGADTSATYRITVTIQPGQTVWANIGIRP